MTKDKTLKKITKMIDRRAKGIALADKTIAKLEESKDLMIETTALEAKLIIDKAQQKIEEQELIIAEASKV